MMSPTQLNPEQLKIINHIEGALLILAPVGTGKTSVLSSRVVKAIAAGIPPEKILCLTFTNRAAKEMQERLAKMCPEQFRYITIKTFHSLCTSILRIEAKNIGLPADFVVYDDTDCLGIVKGIFRLRDDKKAQDKLSQITDCKIKASYLQLSPHYPLEKLFALLGIDDAKLASKYQNLLQERHALDFADLIFYIRSLFSYYPEIKQTWENRFDFIQVDEVQDTHLSEYEIVKCLASRTGNIAIIGDLDQTIYEWRGSEPEEVVSQFKQQFQPQEYSLTWNYRATKILLNTASGFADSFAIRYTKITPATNCENGELIPIYAAKNEYDEAKWIAEQIQNLSKNNPDFPYNRIAVLTRNHKRIGVISQTLEKFNIPCITVEQHHFFARQEIKDALAYLRFIVNPFDTTSLLRMLLRPSRGIGNTTLNHIIKEGEDCGFKLTDMASTSTFIDGDPFSDLITAYDSGTIVVFDVETTGLITGKDEVVEIAAIKLINGEITSEFHHYINNTVTVGYSAQIHGYSDEFLAVNGRDAIDVFSEFLDFIQDAFLVGHNLGFDIKMIIADAQKLGLSTPQLQWGDTWDLAKRFISANSYKLESLANQLNLNQLPTHRAIDDARTTVELLAILIPLIKVHADYRQALVYRYGEQFETLANDIETWKNASQKIRPADLLGKILIESGLYDYYQEHEPKRLESFKNLVKIFQERDNLELHPDTALRNILEYTALAKNVDQISQYNNQVMIITVHQSKGLEFDTVFLAGMCEEEFPNYYSLLDKKFEEEKRLFYVALTRAKNRLFISWFNKDSYNNSKIESQFIDLLPSEYLTY
ncbi:UvrD-helicase domain-containing protein [Sphaerospermopsis aphanizomenoides BCCUSP55]|uniref:3'-5' exonuclease n=1 Tax=Sphaerospermopsis aphanizomenoides TaxID=459663 RepID=UPI0019056777|nr:3'-5' exonuclease [Sphaerospermopsis aphanizomenoides]MBK1990105.1 UvrD-helicase domain-containing protein [Sphaerospermopsis aphanizomenoides BCCUSP55]